MTSCPGASQDQHYGDLTASEANKIIEENSGQTDFILLDVRTPAEYNSGHIKSTKLVDFYSKDFNDKIKNLDKDKTYLIYCRSGGRSKITYDRMKATGFNHLYHLETGIIRWAKERLPLESENTEFPK